MGCAECSCQHLPRYSWEALKPEQRDLMVIGESATVQEIRKGVKMTGAGGTVLKETMQKVGLPFGEDKVYYTLALKCAIPKGKNRKIPKDCYHHCHQYLMKEIEEVRPKLILVCGATALQALLDSTNIKITEEYGRIREGFGCQILPIMNPGVLLHRPGEYKPFLAMMQLAATIYNGGSAVDTGETHYEVLDTQAKCVQLWKHMMQLSREGKLEYVSFDTETTGLDYRTADFLVLGICFEKNKAYVIPREMRNVVHNFLEGVPWKCIWQNGKYDKKVMWRRGLADVSIDEDTMCLHYTLDETSQHDLGYLSKVYLNAAPYKYKMNQNWKAVTLDTYPEFFEALCERVAVDVDYTLQVFHVLKAKVMEEPTLWKVYSQLLMPASNFLSRVEQNGILVDPEYLYKLDDKYTKLLDQIKADIQTLAEPFWDPEAYQWATGSKSAPKTFNPGSPQQMSWMVFDRLKLNPRIKKGRSTDKAILKSIENPPDLVKKVLEYRNVQKEHSTYVIGLLDARDEDGRVRTTFNVHVTATGRLSSKEPNIQNQPSANGVGNIRRCFVAEQDHILAEIDYSGAELRWLGVLSKDPVLDKIFRSGRNLHVETAKMLFGEHYTKAQKLRAKALNFGIIYGRKAQSIAEEHNIPLAEAQEMMDNWFKVYPGAAAFLKWCDQQVVQGNFMESPFGRRRRFGLVSPATLDSLQNEARNFPIQSASSDLLLTCAMECEQPLWDKYRTRIINLIHDSMLLEIPADPHIVGEVGRYCNDVMITAPMRLFNIDLPFKADYEIGKNWSDLVAFELDPKFELEGNPIMIEEGDDEGKHISWEEWYGGNNNVEK